MNVGEVSLSRTSPDATHMKGKAIIQVVCLFNQLLQHCLLQHCPGRSLTHRSRACRFEAVPVMRTFDGSSENRCRSRLGHLRGAKHEKRRGTPSRSSLKKEEYFSEVQEGGTSARRNGFSTVLGRFSHSTNGRPGCCRDWLYFSSVVRGPAGVRDTPRTRRIFSASSQQPSVVAA